MAISSPTARVVHTAFYRDHTRKGFTLTEIAIVLGIIGLILGAIWVAASSVYSNQKTNKSTQEHQVIAQAIRSLYSTSAVSGAADGTNITTSLCNAGVFPSDMIVSCATPAISDPWIAGAAGTGTIVLAESISAANVGDAFAIEMTNVPQAACIAMLGLLGQGGMFGGVSAPPSPVVASASLLALPATIAAISGAAVCGAAATDTVYVVYKLKG